MTGLSPLTAFSIIYGEYFFAIVMDACFVGLMFLRLSRGVRRGYSMLLSGKAVISRIRGQYHFMFQLVDTRPQQSVEAHVRCCEYLPE